MGPDRLGELLGLVRRADLLRWLEEFGRTLSSPVVKQFEELEAQVHPT